MAMSLCGVRPAVLPRVVPQPRRSMPKRQRPSTARPITSAPERPVRTQASEKGQPEAPPPVPAAARADSIMLLTILVSIFTIVGLQKVFIDDSMALLNSKLETISKDVATTNNKLDILNEKLQAQQVQAADLKGQVGVLRDVVTGTTTPTPIEKK